MLRKALKPMTTGVVVGLVGFASAGWAAAQPPLACPGASPVSAAAPIPAPGSYNCMYNVIPVAPPATTDTRGVKTGDNADATQTALGLPGSKLSPSANRSNYLTGSNTRNSIEGGINPPSAPNPGVNVGAGQMAPVLPLEDPGGGAPSSTATAGVESSQPTTAPGGPGVPGPAMESLDGSPPTSAPTTTAPTPTLAPVNPN